MPIHLLALVLMHTLNLTSFYTLNHSFFEQMLPLNVVLS
uniref:Uncharacterized protein n=2 Tax=Anguilla anguilla TaxID=7936 RepID=A0A0E9T7Z7_ANGAN